MKTDLMADNDIYGNEQRYRCFLERLETKVLPPAKRPHSSIGYRPPNELEAEVLNIR